MADHINNGQSGSAVRATLNGNADEIDANTASIVTNTTNIATNASNISSLSTTVSTHTSQIATLTTTTNSLNTALIAQASTIATHTSQIASLTSSVSTNSTDISALQTAVSALTNTKQDKDSVSTLNDEILSFSSAFTNPDTTNNIFIVYETGGGSQNFTIDNDTNNSLIQNGAIIKGVNTSASTDDLVITAGGGGVTIDYLGAATGTIVPGEYFELAKIGTNKWLRTK